MQSKPEHVHRHIITGILGKTRMGKTTFMRELLKSEKRLCMIDPTGNPMLDGYFEMRNLKEAAEALTCEEFQIVCRFSEDETLALMRMLFHPALCDLTIAFDEISVYSSIEKSSLEINKLFLQGGRFNKRIVWNTQRAANVSRNVTTQSTLMLSFRLDEAADTRYLNSKFRNGRFLEYLPAGNYVPVKGDQDDLDFASEIYGFDFSQDLTLSYITLKCRKPQWWHNQGNLPLE